MKTVDANPIRIESIIISQPIFYVTTQWDFAKEISNKTWKMINNPNISFTLN